MGKNVAIPTSALTILFLLAPLAVQTRYGQHVLILVMLYITLASAWNILGGFAGQLSVGHAAFFGIGAYTAAIISTKTSLSSWVALLIGPIVVLPLSMFVGWICFRLRGPYFTLATIAVAEVVRLVALNWRELTGGAVGIVMRPSVFSGASKVPYYYLILVIAVSTVALCFWIKSSKLGYYLMAIREDQDTAESIGINATRYKLIALAISAAVTALAGAFYANYFLLVDPTIVLPLSLSVEIVLMTIIGGRGTVEGPVLGAIVLKLSSEVFRTFFEEANLLIYGALLIVVILFMPGGIIGGLRKLAATRLKSAPAGAHS